jgi:aldehyde:ferredoxin oxidoreductase
MAFGSNCLIADFGAILKANYLCNDYAMDVISAGCVVAFAMECYEKGILSAERAGYELNWGNHKAMVALMHDIAFRKGFGDVLAEGSRRAADAIGGDAVRYSMDVKGMEISGQDGRGHRSVGLTHAISIRGADHLRSLVTVDQLGYQKEAAKRFGDQSLPDVCDPYKEEQKAHAVKTTEDAFAIRDSLITCWYTCGWPPEFWFDDFGRAISLSTGYSKYEDPEKLRWTAERICNLRKLFNIREGMSRKDDTLPERFTKEPIPEGPSKGQVVNLDVMLDDYYDLRGWDREGYPTLETAKRLGLEREWKEVLG